MKPVQAMIVITLLRAGVGCETTESKSQSGTGSRALPDDPSQWRYLTIEELWPDPDFSADEPTTIQFPTIGFGQTQKASNWCWAASVAMAINGLVDDRVITQERVVEELFGGVLPDRGANAFDIVSAIDGRTISVPFEHGDRVLVYTIHVTHIIPGVPPWDFLFSIADGNHAAILLVPEHAVVLVMASNIKSFKQMTVHDPWPRRGLMDISLEDATTPGSNNRIEGVIVLQLSEAIR